MKKSEKMSLRTLFSGHWVIRTAFQPGGRLLAGVFIKFTYRGQRNVTIRYDLKYEDIFTSKTAPTLNVNAIKLRNVDFDKIQYDSHPERFL